MISERVLSILRCLGAVGVVIGSSMSSADSSTHTGSHPLAANEERRILVAFRDGSIDRVASGDSTNGYRRRGHYDTSTWGSREAGQLGEKYALAQIDQWPIPVLGMHCVVYRVPDDRSVEQTLDGLQRDRSVDLAERMRTFRTLAEEQSEPYARLQPAFKTMHLAEVHRYATGENVQVAVIDTGIDLHHPDLLDQITDAKNFTGHQDDRVADIHGTAVAGIIAALAHNRTGIIGVAPDAKVLSLKACWPERENRPESVCDTFTLAQALNSAIEKHIRIVNLSLAGPRDPLLELMLRKGIERGTIFVASVPPDGSPDDFPSSVDGVIAVRSVGSRAAVPGIATHSVTAPGTEILTTMPNGTYNFVSGSSYATAHVSGIIALMLQAKGDLDSRTVLDILRGSSLPQGDGGEGSSHEPVVDACRVFSRIDPRAACLGPI